MKIGVLGVGAIGGLILGYLSDQGLEAEGVVKDYQKQSLGKEGLIIEGTKGLYNCNVKADTRLKKKVDLAIFATKINDLERIINKNIKYLKDAIVLSTQNGVRADYILEKYFPKERIITGIVMFGATFYAPNRIAHNFEGNLILGNIFGKEVDSLGQVREILSKSFNTVVIDNIKGAKYLKLFINLNNCIPAILGISMQDTFKDLELAKLAIELNKEAFNIVGKGNIELEDLPSYPKQRIQGLVSMDIEQAADIFSKAMTSLSEVPLYGSILQSIKRKKLSEIDYINGEIVSLAKNNNLIAPLNEKIVGLVHKVERTNSFLNKENLLNEIKIIKEKTNG